MHTVLTFVHHSPTISTFSDVYTTRTITALTMGNVLCCGNADQVDDANDGQVVITSRKPPVQCEGYSPAMLPNFLTSQEIVDFYLSYQVEGEARQLACSLIRCMDNRQARSSNLSNWTWVQSSFDIDSSKPVIILCHGYMSWRNQMLLVFLAGHLSRKLHCHVLRFDFSGNGHSSSEWKYGGYDVEARDLDQVIRFVREQLKCQVSCIIGHSKGAIPVFRRAWEQEGMPAEGSNSVLCQLVWALLRARRDVFRTRAIYKGAT